MSGGNEDWYPVKLADQAEMYRNVAQKIDEYKVKFNLTDEYIAEVKLICATFESAYQSLVQIRATKRQMEKWFKNILDNEKEGKLITFVPSFQTISLPVGAFVGIKKRFRRLMRFLKSQTNYSRGDGENLMIVASQFENKNYDNAAPKFKITVDERGNVIFSYKRGKFTGIEIQWRKSGETVWHFAEKTTEVKASFTPPLSANGVPEKLEFRGSYLMKNQRVGKWSPIYTKNVG